MAWMFRALRLVHSAVKAGHTGMQSIISDLNILLQATDVSCGPLLCARPMGGGVPSCPNSPGLLTWKMSYSQKKSDYQEGFAVFQTRKDLNLRRGCEDSCWVRKAS